MDTRCLPADLISVTAIPQVCKNTTAFMEIAQMGSSVFMHMLRACAVPIVTEYDTTDTARKRFNH